MAGSEPVAGRRPERRIAFVKAKCVLLTAGPAAGKTCLISQLVIHSVDSSHDLTPIMIRVQDLQVRQRRSILCTRAQSRARKRPPSSR